MDGRFLHVVEHYTALKRSKALTAATTWVNPENTVLNERHYCCIICTAGKSRDKRETGQAIPKTGSGWWLLGTRTGNRVQVPAGLGFCSEGGTCRWRVHCLSPASNPGRCGGQDRPGEGPGVSARLPPQPLPTTVHNVCNWTVAQVFTARRPRLSASPSWESPPLTCLPQVFSLSPAPPEFLPNSLHQFFTPPLLGPDQ